MEDLERLLVLLVIKVRSVEISWILRKAQNDGATEILDCFVPREGQKNRANLLHFALLQSKGQNYGSFVNSEGQSNRNHGILSSWIQNDGARFLGFSYRLRSKGQSNQFFCHEKSKQKETPGKSNIREKTRDEGGD